MRTIEIPIDIASFPWDEISWKYFGQQKKQNRVIFLFCECQCKFKTLRWVRAADLKNKQSTRCKSCSVSLINGHKKTHGDSRGSRLWKIWQGMKYRCQNPDSKDFANYGNKGVEVCEEWKNNYPRFKYWAIVNGYNPILTIDRIDGNKSYCPENCRWVSVSDQNRNKKTNVFLTHYGKTLCLADWARELQIGVSTLRYRFHAGKSPEEILKRADGRNK